MNKSVFKKEFLSFFIIVCMGCSLAINYTLFITPNNFAPAGINGIAVMIQYKLNFSIGYMSLLINIPLSVLAYFFVDKKFAIKSLIFSVSYSLFYLLFSNLDIERFKYYSGSVDTIYPVLLSGVISGVISGVLFKMNGSTGGTDIISKIVNKYKPQFNFFWIILVLNSVVSIASYFVYAENVNGEMVYNYKPVCLCLVYCLIISVVGNKIISGSKQAYKFIIITEHALEIEEEIIKTLKHSATRLQGYGSYSHTGKDVLISVVNKHQLIDFQNILKKYDKTFAFVETANQILGNFKSVKHVKDNH